MGKQIRNRQLDASDVDRSMKRIEKSAKHMNIYVSSVRTTTPASAFPKKMQIVDSSSSNEWVSTVEVNAGLILLKLKTRAQMNILSLRYHKELTSRPKLITKSMLLHAYNGNKIQTSGVCRVKVTSQDKAVSAIFVVVPMDAQLILGLKT